MAALIGFKSRVLIGLFGIASLAPAAAFALPNHSELACHWDYYRNSFCDAHSPCIPSLHLQGELPPSALDSAGKAEVRGTVEPTGLNFTLSGSTEPGKLTAAGTDTQAARAVSALSRDARTVTATLILQDSESWKSNISLRCEVQWVGTAPDPIHCPIYDCAPPPAGCSYDFANAPKAPNGCTIGCGPLVCNGSGGGDL